MAMPENELEIYFQQLQQQLQLQQQHLQHQHQQLSNNPFSDMYNNFRGQIQHPAYIPQFHPVGFAPGPVDGIDGGLGYGSNSFLEHDTYSQISSLDFLQQPRSVSTVSDGSSDGGVGYEVSSGLGFSLYDGRFGDSSFITLIGDEVARELQRHGAQMERLIKHQGYHLRQVVLQEIQAKQLQTISYIEDKFIQKLNAIEAKIDDLNKKNMELESQLKNLVIEAGNWQERAKYSENLINNLMVSLQQVYAQSSYSKDVFVDSEVDDTIMLQWVCQ